MFRERALAAALAWVSAVLPAAASMSLPAVAPASLAGVARDVSGRALPDVAIILLDERNGSRVVASTVTDAGGRFFVAGIPAGLYRVAAIKVGYLASMGSVNTVLRSTLDLLLRPAPRPGEPGAERVRSDAAWVLRAPERSVMRDTGAVSLVADDSIRRGRRTAGESLEGRFEHLIALAGWNGAGDGARSDVQGGTTTLGLGGALGSRGSLRFEGSRDRFATPSSSGTPAVDREATAVALDFDYPTGHGAGLAMKAFYSRKNIEAGFVDSPGAGRDVERSHAWGYDATWTRQVDTGSRVALKIGFVDTALEFREAEGPGQIGVQRGVLNRAAGAEGSFESEAGGGHRVAVGVRAQLLDLADPAFRSGHETLVPGVPTAPGWSVRLKAADAWSVNGPFTIVYGLAVHQVLGRSDGTLLTPTLGAAWNNDRLRVAASGTYHAVATGRQEADGASGLFRPRRSLGYDASIEAELPDGTVCRGRYVYSPLQFDRGIPVGAFDGQIYWTDGNAADRRIGFALERDFGRGRATLEIFAGRATGNLAHLAAFDLPVVILDERDLEYRAGRVGVVFESTGTDFAIEYRRLVESGRSGASEDSMLQAFVEIHLAQEVLRLRRLGASCRVLLVARTPTGPVGSAEAAARTTARAAAALNHRISAGLSVSF